MKIACGLRRGDLSLADHNFIYPKSESRDDTVSREVNLDLHDSILEKPGKLDVALAESGVRSLWAVRLLEQFKLQEANKFALTHLKNDVPGFEPQAPRVYE